MWDAIHKNREVVKQRYVASKRHMLEVAAPSPPFPLHSNREVLHTCLPKLLTQRRNVAPKTVACDAFQISAVQDFMWVCALPD